MFTFKLGKGKFYLAIIAVLVSIILLQRIFQPKPTDLNDYIKIGGKEYVLLSSKVDTLWLPQDTIKVPEYVPVPGDVVTVEVPIDVDTIAILKDYYSKYYYSDVVPLDSIGTATISDTISKNKIISRSIIFDYKIPIIKETIVVQEDRVNKMFIGGGINVANEDFINSVYIGVILKTKRDKMFGLNIGASTVNNELFPYVGGSMYWKIRMRK